MQYANLADLKAYGNITTSDDDDVLDVLLSAAAELINGHCGRVFLIAASTDRTFRRRNGDWDGRTLWFGAELAELVSVTGTPTVIKLPENDPPYTRMQLDPADVVGWADPTVVNGYWGYSKTPPAAIVECSLRLAKWLYDLRTTKPVDFVTVTPFGQVIVPATLPLDVVMMLAPYRRQVRV